MTSETIVRTPVRPHPGLSDPAYLRRRDAIVASAEGHRVGAPSPPVDYTEREHETWRRVHAALTVVQEDTVCRRVLRARDAAPIPADHVPQHAEVGDRLHELTGFRFTLAGGLVPDARFLGSMARGYFHAVQYVRHPAMPLYTPEPDVLHDVFAHGTHLSSPWFADLYRLVGATASRVTDPDALALISRVYWFTLEYGVAFERGRVKAYGAALLSSYGELGQLHRADIRPWALERVVNTPYTAAGYQPVLYAVRSLDHVADALHEFLDEFDGDPALSPASGAAPRPSACRARAPG